MSAGKHTPGPWRLKTSQDGDGICIYAGIYGIGKAWDLNGNPQNQANAHVMVAAPDLVEVVRDIVSDCKGAINPGLYDLAVAALAKAEGRS